MAVNWHELFTFTVSPIELVVRGTAIYWLLFLLLRFVIRRDVGALGVADVLLLVLMADAAQNAMAGEYRSISDGTILLFTIVGWNVAVNWMSFHSRMARRVLEPPMLPLVRNGNVVHGNLRREYITLDELEAQLREQGIDDVGDVRAAYLESDGSVSVIPRERANSSAGSRRRRRERLPEA